MNKNTQDGGAIAALNYPGIPVSYAGSIHYFGYNGLAPNSIALIQSPASKIMVLEEGNTSTGDGHQVTEVAADWNTGTLFRDRLFAGHTGLSNYLFGDGHVKAMRPTQTMGTAANPFNMWGAFTDTTGPSCTATSWNGGADAGDPNCDSPSVGAMNNLAALQAHYQ